MEQEQQKSEGVVGRAHPWQTIATGPRAGNRPVVGCLVALASPGEDEGMDELAVTPGLHHLRPGPGCLVHPAVVRGVSICPQCGSLVCATCEEIGEGERPGCVLCSQSYALPWEDRAKRQTALLFSWWQSVRLLLRDGRRALRGVARGRAETALGFGMLSYCFGMAFYLPLSAALKWTASDGSDPTRLLAVALSLGTLLTLPFWAAAALFSSSAFMWLFMRSVGGQGSYRATLRGLSYSTAPMVLYLVPLLGWIVGSFWQLSLMVEALGQVHGLKASRVLLGLFLPVVALVLLAACVALLFHGLAPSP